MNNEISLESISDSCKQCANNVKIFIKDNKNKLVKEFGSRAIILCATVILSVVILNMVFHNKSIYKFTNKNLSGLLGGSLADDEGKPTTRGLVVHSILMGVVLVALVLSMVYLLGRKYL